MKYKKTEMKVGDLRKILIADGWQKTGDKRVDNTFHEYYEHLKKLGRITVVAYDDDRVQEKDKIDFILRQAGIIRTG